jgi:hypothetical protein
VSGGFGGIFEGMGPFLLDFAAVGLEEYPDAATPVAAALASLVGDDSSGAAVQNEGPGSGYRTQFLVFPWEAIKDAAERLSVIQAIIESCSIATDPPLFADDFESGGTGEWSDVVD